jgi:hypothetical protein
VYLSSRNQVKAAIAMLRTFKIYEKMVQIQKNLLQEELKNYKKERRDQGLRRYTRKAERRAYRGKQNIPENSFAAPLFVNREENREGRGAGRGRIPEIG